MFQILHRANAIVMFHFAYCYPSRMLEWNMVERLFYSHRSALHFHIEYDVAGKLRSPSFRQQALW